MGRFNAMLKTKPIQLLTCVECHWKRFRGISVDMYFRLSRNLIFRYHSLSIYTFCKGGYMRNPWIWAFLLRSFYQLTLDSIWSDIKCVFHYRDEKNCWLTNNIIEGNKNQNKYECGMWYRYGNRTNLVGFSFIRLSKLN